jgi:hypothetical protein
MWCSHKNTVSITGNLFQLSVSVSHSLSLSLSCSKKSVYIDCAEVVPQVAVAHFVLKDFGDIIAEKMNRAGVKVPRLGRHVVSKIEYLEKCFKSAHDFAHTSTGAGLQETDEGTFQDAVKKKCLYIMMTSFQSLRIVHLHVPRYRIFHSMIFRMKIDVRELP